jgi:glycosyltransferase involved in cell wall biosynthesis
MSPPDVSIIVPLFNEAENLPVLAAEIEAALASRPETYEVLFVNDGSTDDSLAVLRGLAAADGRRKILTLAKNAGQSAALAVGLDHAAAAVAVTLDADLQNDPADIALLLSKLGDCDMVTGVRVARQDGWLKRLSSRIANAVRGRLLKDATPDTGCSLKAFKVEALRRAPRFNGMHRFLPALVMLEGGRLCNVPVRHRPRLHGRTKYNVSNRLWRGLADLFGLFWLQRRWLRRKTLTEVQIWTQDTSDSS